MAECVSLGKLLNVPGLPLGSNEELGFTSKAGILQTKDSDNFISNIKLPNFLLQVENLVHAFFNSFIHSFIREAFIQHLLFIYHRGELRDLMSLRTPHLVRK